MIRFEFEENGSKRMEKSAPWIEYYHSLKELFGGDPDIVMDIDEQEPSIIMHVNGDAKYEALCKLLPGQKTYGNVTLYILIFPANERLTTARMLDNAFAGNPNYAFTKVVNSPMMSNPMTFVVFKKKIAQFFNDNLGDLYGNTSTLYENIARDILAEQDGVFYCTDKE
jgi:hypothetical protein